MICSATAWRNVQAHSCYCRLVRDQTRFYLVFEIPFDLKILFIVWEVWTTAALAPGLPLAIILWLGCLMAGNEDMKGG